MTLPDLRDYGVRHMTDEEIEGFMASQGVGILGLPGDAAPTLRPISYALAEDRIYLFFVDGEGSRKKRLASTADAATFLVFSVETPFNWRSVLLTGPVEEVREPDRKVLLEDLSFAWRPAIFERVEGAIDSAVFELDVETRTGVKHLGLPEGMQPSSN